MSPIGPMSRVGELLSSQAGRLRYGLRRRDACTTRILRPGVKSEQAPGVGRGLAGELLQRHAAERGQGGGRVGHQRRLVPLLLAAERLGREIGAVGLDQDPIGRDPRRQPREAIGTSCSYRSRCRQNSRKARGPGTRPPSRRRPKRRAARRARGRGRPPRATWAARRPGRRGNG